MTMGIVHGVRDDDIKMFVLYQEKGRGFKLSAPRINLLAWLSQIITRVSLE
jgi:hypothetical protein